MERLEISRGSVRHPSGRHNELVASPFVKPISTYLNEEFKSDPKTKVIFSTADMAEQWLLDIYNNPNTQNLNKINNIFQNLTIASQTANIEYAHAIRDLVYAFLNEMWLSYCSRKRYKKEHKPTDKEILSDGTSSLTVTRWFLTNHPFVKHGEKPIKGRPKDPKTGEVKGEYTLEGKKYIQERFSYFANEVSRTQRQNVYEMKPMKVTQIRSTHGWRSDPGTGVWPLFLYGQST